MLVIILFKIKRTYTEFKTASIANPQNPMNMLDLILTAVKSLLLLFNFSSSKFNLFFWFLDANDSPIISFFFSTATSTVS